MKIRLLKASLVLALPLALLLATPLARAADQKDLQRKAATKTVTHDVATTGENGGTMIAHSIHDWHPEIVTTQTTRTITEPAATPRTRRAHREAATEHAQEVKP
jgi:hypothetical protein